MTHATDPLKTADSLLQSCFDAYGVADSSQYLHAWYHTEEPQTVIANAQKAMDLYLAELRHLDLEPLIECTRKVAWCSHFQAPEFAYQENLPECHKVAVAEIEVCIAVQKTLPLSPRLGYLYENAAQIAIPHFFYGFQMPVSRAAEDSAYLYLENAAKVYQDLKQPADALRCLRLIDRRDLKFLLRKVAFARENESTNSLLFAKDVAELFHELIYNTIDASDQPLVEEYATLAIATFQSQPPSEERSGQLSNLHRSIGYYHLKSKDDPSMALEHYKLAQAAEVDAGMELYYNAFFIAALEISLGNLTAADAQYSLALSGKPLSATDAECAFFGRALVAWMQGRKDNAKGIWRENIRDHTIMNGISGFQSRFPPSKQAEIRQQALALIQAVGAPNALRIVQTDWISQK